MNIDEMTDNQIQEYLIQRKVHAETWPKITTIYAHRDKESNYDVAASLGLDPRATERFAYTAAELLIELRVNENGEAWAVRFDDLELQEPILIS